jgi:hypothetical protein
MPARTDAMTSGTSGGNGEANRRAVKGLAIERSENGHGSTMG